MEAGLAGVTVLGVERRRRWSDAAKLSILAEVDANDWTPSDVARRHDVTRQHLYQWRRELRMKGMLPTATPETFVPVEVLPCLDAPQSAICEAATPEITITLRNGRQLRCRETIADPALVQLLRMLETT